MERKTRPGIAQEEPLDYTSHSPLRNTSQQGRVRVDPVPSAKPLPEPTWRPLNGAKQNNRGQQRMVPIPLNPVDGTPAILVPSIVQTPQDNGEDGEVISVQLGMDLPQSWTDPAGAHFELPLTVTCILEWGVGGAVFTAECDWNQGTSFSVCASYVRVSARINAIPATFAASTEIVLKAGFGYGDASSINVSSPLRLTVPLGNDGEIAGGASFSFAVPPWAVGFTVVDGGTLAAVPPLGPPDYSIDCVVGLGVVLASYRLVSRSNTAIQVEGQFPIPSGCRTMKITNNLFNPTVGSRILFNLAF